MKINEIIKEKRKHLGYTQEQLATFLGVSTPAVSKWESGVTYPDITLLPIIARLLNTDLNTLLSFKEDLSNEELEEILNKTYSIVEKENYEVGFNYAMDKIKEYPNNELLTFNLALTLDGLLTINIVENHPYYKKIINNLYENLVRSTNIEIQNQSTIMLMNKYLIEENYDKVKNLIDTMPKNIINQNIYLANLYIKTNKLKEASQILSSELINSITSSQNILYKMIEIALLENNFDDANYFSMLYKKLNIDFDLIPLNYFTSDLEIALKEKNIQNVIEILDKMLSSFHYSWNPNNSRLYQMPDVSESNFNEFILQFIPSILNELETSEEYSFLRENDELEKLIAKYKEKYCKKEEP